ncbi:voltage-dependent calcium channel subunit alpha-2/delta-1-like isoform X2 [Pollicipes pollicipes]|uniref:voltage-dependent calcium channel subunit alpha-2/delta-1-like isoform X2 n=1 Tax=Pollicipes pollicipes TaxID=41117 RepID=UPI00188509A6|nr:voltage-dependent calcium channel subunit alpha-2/delta-1-like isoform X2 [Pollicipes pollicipes]
MAIIRTHMLVLCFLLLQGSSHGAEDELPSSEMINQLARSLGTELGDVFMTSSKYDVLQTSYRDDLLSSVRFEEVNAEAELASMATKITDIFTKRSRALKDIVTTAEDQTFIYEYDPNLQTGDVALFKMAKYNESSPDLELDEHFGREVNFSQSGVHTPLEVYEGWFFAKYKGQLTFMDDRDVLNGLRWSAAVDRTFRANRDRDPTISWQYLGSQLGFMRVYPATWWQPPPALDGVDLYDVRRRPWYIEGSVSPKDVVILMDISGSVHGQTFEIMKISVKTVLNTLGENDYVNIAWSTNHAGWANPCMDTLVPATMINKRTLFAAVDAMQARNTSDWAKGLDFAYKAFVDFYSQQPEHAGAKCHKLIMFFSDGGTEWPGAVIDKYKNETLTKDVRLFTYALGPHPVPSHIMRRMACENGGFFSVIVASGAIRTAIQTYAQTLGALVPPEYLHMGSVHFARRGLGYVTTLSMPVFNRSEASDGQSLLGVAGVDVTMREIHRHAPWKKLGPFGYTFAINPNGIVLFHPRLREPLHYMEDPPDLDLTLLEGDNHVVKDLRTQMIRRNSNSVSMNQTVVLEDGHVVHVRNLQYTYRPVDNTTLSLGLVLPARQTHMVVFGQSVSGGLPRCDGCLLAPSWEYCPGLTADGAERWQQLSDQLKAGAEGCAADLVQHLAWDAKWTGAAPEQWQTAQESGVDARFVVTDGGLTRFYPVSSGADLSSELDPYRSGLYRHASLTEDLIFRPRAESGRVLAARRIAVASSTGGIYTLAVVGVQYNATWLWERVDRVLAACSEEAGVRCWLLDTAGDVVYSSGESRWLGQHLGLEDPELMAALVNATVYKQDVVYNYQGVCRKKRPNASAAPSLADPLRWLNVDLLVDLAAGALSVLDHLRYLLASALLSYQAPAAAALDEFGFEINAFEHSCTQRLARTELTRSRRPYQGELRCPVSGCVRSFRASLVADTNLVLVAASLPCGCPELAGEDLPFRPEEDVGPDRCGEDKTPLFRRRPDACFATHEKEKPACSGSGLATASLLLLPLTMAARVAA